MWAHYADQFRGMCVKYRLRRLLNGLPDKISVTRMMYLEVEPVLLNEKSMSADGIAFVSPVNLSVGRTSVSGVSLA